MGVKKLTLEEVLALVPWLCECVVKGMPSFLASKGPLNRNSMAIHATAPSPSFSLQRASVSDAASAQALPGKQADRDFGLVQPTAVLGGVLYAKPIPQPASLFLPTPFHHRLARMRTQIVQH